MATCGVYLDHNATTPLAPSVVAAITNALTEAWGNPSSSHPSGRKAREVVEDARAKVAAAINADPHDIIFTSGGTESNNTVLHSALRHHQLAHPHTAARPHIVLTNLEHDSLTKPADIMGRFHEVETTMVTSTPSGAVSVDDIIHSIKENTVLVCVMHANNETGVIQPVEGIASALAEYNAKNNRRVYLHVDAAQTLGKIKVDMCALGADYVTVVGQKCYGPRIGALYVKHLGKEDGAPLHPLLHGGGQEGGWRSGTENTPMIAGLGEACRLVTEHQSEYAQHMQTVRDALEVKLEAAFGKLGVHFNGRCPDSERIPNTCNVSILGHNLTGRALLAAAPAVQASVGAACHSDVIKPSPILLSMGIPHEVAAAAIRLTVGRDTTLDDVSTVVEHLRQAVASLGQIVTS